MVDPAKAAPASVEAFIAQVRERFTELSPQLQAGAAYLLDFPDEVAIYSMRKVAEHAAVQPASLVRLSQVFGFPGWNELRALFVARMRTVPEIYAAKAETLLDHADTDALMHEMFRAQRQNLQATEALSVSGLANAARLLHDARHVHIAGFRGSFPVAFMLHYLYRQFRSSVSLVSATGGTLEVELRALDPDDAVLAVSFAPYSSEATQLASAARQTGCRLIAIADSAASSIGLGADQTLLFSGSSPSIFPSIAAGVGVAEALLAQLLTLDQGEAVRRIARNEARLRTPDSAH
jgi:DNA-binding MurR/RpiR family transcriptional regulator